MKKVCILLTMVLMLLGLSACNSGGGVGLADEDNPNVSTNKAAVESAAQSNYQNDDFATTTSIGGESKQIYYAPFKIVNGVPKPASPNVDPILGSKINVDNMHPGFTYYPLVRESDGSYSVLENSKSIQVVNVGDGRRWIKSSNSISARHGSLVPNNGISFTVSQTSSSGR